MLYNDMVEYDTEKAVPVNEAKLDEMMKKMNFNIFQPQNESKEIIMPKRKAKINAWRHTQWEFNSEGIQWPQFTKVVQSSSASMAKILKCGNNEDRLTMEAQENADTIAFMFESPNCKKVRNHQPFFVYYSHFTSFYFLSSHRSPTMKWNWWTWIKSTWKFRKQTMRALFACHRSNSLAFAAIWRNLANLLLLHAMQKVKPAVLLFDAVTIRVN